MFFSGLLVKKLARSLLCNFRTIGAEQPNRDGRQPMAGFNAFHISTLGMMAQSDNQRVIDQQRGCDEVTTNASVRDRVVALGRRRNEFHDTGHGWRHRDQYG